MANQLIPVFNGSISNETALLCDARNLHTFLEVGRDFSNWIRERISEYELAANLDYIIFTPNLAKTPGRRRKEYHLTLDTAKELAMVERNDKGRQIRRYFIECEKRLRENHCHSISSTSYDSRTLCYKRAGITINEIPLNDSDLVISLESWLQLAQKNGWVVMQREGLANKLTNMIENCISVN
ncbi:MAG TPA: antA/AntB antirepressor family protein [Cedecea sp.]|jgi:phage anti-repressor protein